MHRVDRVELWAATSRADNSSNILTLVKTFGNLMKKELNGKKSIERREGDKEVR